MGGRQYSLKISAPLPPIKTFRIRPLSGRSIYLKIITETVAELEKSLREQKRTEELNLMFDIAVELNMYPSRYISYIYLFKLLPHSSRHLLHVSSSFPVSKSTTPPLSVPVQEKSYRRSMAAIPWSYSLDLTAVLHVHLNFDTTISPSLTKYS